MEEIIINYNQITKVKVNRKSINIDVRYRGKPRAFEDFILKLFGGYKPYFSIYNGMDVVKLKEIEEWCAKNDCYVENNTIYYKPYLKIYLSSGYNDYMFISYDTEKEMDDEIEQIKNKIPTLIIEC